MINPSWPTVKHGTWLYDGQVTSTVRIVRGDVIYGSYDHEDPPDVREDRACECFYVVYNRNTDGGVFLTLEAAVAKIESLVGENLRWQSTQS